MINRDVKRLESLIESIPALTKADREVKSASDLMRELRAAESHNQEIQKNESRLSDLRAIIKSSRSDIEEWTNLINKEKLKINELISEGKALQEVLKSSHVIDTDQIESAIENAEAVADSVAKMRQREAAQAELKDAKAKSESLSSKLEKLKLDKAEKIRSAKLPYDGLDFGENGLLLNGVPLEQINDAEKLKICTSIGIASNPKVRAIFIRNGSLLDDDGMKILAEIAKKNDMHIWIERVGDKDKCAIVLEDGEAKE